MNTARLENYRTPVTDYPACKFGKAEISHIRRGTRPTYWAEGVQGYFYYQYKNPATITVLKIGGSVWMTDEFPYLASLEHFAGQAKGKVLVAGLGLGIVVHQLAHNPNVTQIDVVDRELDVIRLVQPLLPADPRIHVHHDDFYKWMERAAQGDYRPDTVIWDLAVGTKGEISEGKEIPIVRHMIAAHFGTHKYDLSTRKFVPSPNYNPDLEIFVHGIDRDPVGEAFVKTREFRRASAAIAGDFEKMERLEKEAACPK